ncbi:polyprenyl synthetase family protein [Streptomyces sp. NBC_01615]|uniref:polyprenyl synthetase family protein n=1 Tax=Streptomyces sp. NBC_01615 TaxID=2975898 RepID=UPI00386DFD8A
MATAFPDPANPDLHGRAIESPPSLADEAWDDELAALLTADLERLLPLESTSLLDAAARHALLPAGKLLRPMLLVRSALAAGGLAERVLPAAAGLECAHVGSLIHDDLIDQDSVRRGRRAVHDHYGPGVAIVAGNSLFFTWFEALAECAARGVPHARIVAAARLQARAGRLVCEGAARELAQAAVLETSVEDYMEMVRLKTAALTSAACWIGATLAGARPARTEALAAFGEALGMAFQIRDDLLPYGPASEDVGKPANSDLRNRRPTLPVLIARDQATPAQRDELLHAFTTQPTDEHAEAIRAVVTATGADFAAAEAAERHTTLAIRHLSRVPETIHRRHLEALAIGRGAGR